MRKPGEQLQAARETKGLAPEQAATALKITLTRLQILETDDYTDGHVDVFQRGHLRHYCRLLDIDADDYFIQLRELGFSLTDRPITQGAPKEPSLGEHQRTEKLASTLDKRWLIVLFSTLVLIAWALYLVNTVPLPIPKKPSTITAVSPAARDMDIKIAVTPTIIQTKPVTSATGISAILHPKNNPATAPMTLDESFLHASQEQSTPVAPHHSLTVPRPPTHAGDSG